MEYIVVTNMKRVLGGYFGKREDGVTTDYVRNLDEWMELVARTSEDIAESDREIILSTDPIENTDYAIVRHRPLLEKAGNKSAVAIASWTTALARCRLNKVLQAYSTQILYCDTGSTIVALILKHTCLCVQTVCSCGTRKTCRCLKPLGPLAS